MAETSGLGRTGMILVSLLALSIITVIALQAATLHLYRTNNNEDNMSGGSPNFELPLQDYLRQTFPGQFYTDFEIADFARSFANLSATVLNATIPDVFTPECVGDMCTVDMVEMHTCCCKIHTGFVSPPTAVDIYGQNRTLARFGGNSQYFYTESCTQTGFDSSCSCIESPIVTTGVYNVDVTSNQYGIAFFQLGNTCVALNV